MVSSINKAWRKLGFVVYIKSVGDTEPLLLLYRMGQAATLPCRRGESYVTELYEWFRKFINECPSGLITLHEFQRHFCNGTVGSESAEYAEQIFRTLDNNGDGVVDFREYVMAISMLIEGSAVEKLRWSFKLYDKDRDGAITREEMLEIMQAVYQMSVAAALTKPNPLTAEECTNRIFVRLDKDKNAIISLEEFIEGALDDDWIREMLECDPRNVKVERPPRRDTALGPHG
ncbi:guanylyl cyclase inhibitory protein [Micropterus salmoides]|uniref:guanylyl cyclase inhibitory protein n=1 Tax=Micropterus salmoides TaxID=27706 RepID=UPI0018EDF4C6|nr:guanylyl cyclase inhibitory protein [Micropterus salmoides]